MIKLFKRLKKEKTMVFIDYESYYYSYKTIYGTRPEPRTLRENLEKEFDIANIMVFADFSSPGLADELGSIRSLTNNIIETGNTYNNRKKDMTDFIMLDYIYQLAYTDKKAGTYILITGDGHFQSVVRYLSLKRKKKVIVYGVRNCISRLLREAAYEVRELPMDEEIQELLYKEIAQNMEKIREREDVLPTFISTVGAVSKQVKSATTEEIQDALQNMLKEGYFYQEMKTAPSGRDIRVIVADWGKLQSAGLID